MMAVFSQQLARYRGQIIGWGLGLGILAFILIAFYSSLEGQAEQLEQLVEMYPPEMMAFFGGLEDFASPAGYLNAEFFSYMPIIVGIFTILAGSGLLASDEENGTLDLIAAQPISRTALFLGRLLAFVSATIIILASTWLVLVGSATATNFPATALEVLRPFLSLFALIMFHGMLALLLSMLVPSRRLAAMLTGIFMIIGWFLTSLANLDENLARVADFSPFTYYQGGDAMQSINIAWLAGLLLAAVLFGGLAWWRFEMRDIRVAGEGGWRLSLPRRRTA